MNASPVQIVLLKALLGLSSLAMPAQSWDATTLAIGWAHQDRDDSFTFYDEFSAALQTWTRDGGLVLSTPLGNMPVVPEKWIIDPLNNHWVIAGLKLIQVGPRGKILNTTRLPAEVADVGWDTKGFVLSYRTPRPYLEKRDYFTGSVIWSFGSKSGLEDGPAPLNRRSILVDETGRVLMADGNSLNLTILNATNGSKVADTNLLLLDGRPVPALEGALLERAPMALWPGKEVVFAAVKTAQIPAPLRPSAEGLALARLDLKQSRLEFLPTGLDETCTLIGMLDSDAVFVKPKGGLQLVRVR